MTLMWIEGILYRCNNMHEHTICERIKTVINNLYIFTSDVHKAVKIMDNIATLKDL